jgi:hypothetical protein
LTIKDFREEGETPWYATSVRVIDADKRSSEKITLCNHRALKKTIKFLFCFKGIK